MKKIVIVGSGYAGVNAGLTVAKKLKDQASITIIDRESYHLAYTYLYEVATSPENVSNLMQLKKSVAVPIGDIFRNTNVKFQPGTVVKIDSEKNEVHLENTVIPYDYLVVALGSESNYYGIPGAEENSIGLKSVNNALAIRNKIQFLVEAHKDDMIKPLLRTIVAGGGFAGVEIAAELKGLLDYLSTTNKYPREKLEVRIVEGTNQLMPGLGERVGHEVYKHLKSLGTEIQVNSMITKVDDKFVEFKNGERLEHDCIIWTAGIKAKQIPFTTELELDRGGRIVTDNTLRPTQLRNVFIAGDQASFTGPDGRPLPTTARHAIDQGIYIGRSLAQLVNQAEPTAYNSKVFGYIVPLGGKWAIFKTPHFFMKGFLPYVFRQVAMFHYFYTILGLTRAIKLSFLENELYSLND
jgi:NADH:ubiquinone reductase (H+-translocating)